MKYILVATSVVDAVDIIKICFETGYRIEPAQSLEETVDLFQRKRYDFVFIDIDLLKSLKTENDYKNQLQLFWRINSDVEIIVLALPQQIRDAVNAVKAGASNYLTHPLNPEEVKYVVDSLQEYKRMHSELDYLRDRFWRTDSLSVLQTNSMKMKEVFSRVRAVAPTESTVLLTGETGTGKGVIARLIHKHSQRSTKQFISVHCGAIPDTLLESELFGHEKGAFTGAVKRKLGKFEIAHGGTIFLDEIGTISAAMQIKLLQVLQDRMIVRVGGENEIKTDVRIIAATNTNLKQLCDQGLFRSDLYYRLNVFPLEIPPLRERVEDIPILVDNFLKRLNRLNAKNISDIHPDVLDAFEAYSWPGNIRELENLIERAYILETSSILTPKSFPMELFSDQTKKNRHIIDTSRTLKEVRKHEIERIERQYLTELLAKNRGRINATAEAAGISERQLHKLLTRYGISKETFKHGAS